MGGNGVSVVCCHCASVDGGGGGVGGGSGGGSGMCVGGGSCVGSGDGSLERGVGSNNGFGGVVDCFGDSYHPTPPVPPPPTS